MLDEIVDSLISTVVQEKLDFSTALPLSYLSSCSSSPLSDTSLFEANSFSSKDEEFSLSDSSDEMDDIAEITRPRAIPATSTYATLVDTPEPDSFFEHSVLFGDKPSKRKQDDSSSAFSSFSVFSPFPASSSVSADAKRNRSEPLPSWGSPSIDSTAVPVAASTRSNTNSAASCTNTANAHPFASPVNAPNVHPTCTTNQNSLFSNSMFGFPWNPAGGLAKSAEPAYGQCCKQLFPGGWSPGATAATFC